LDATYTNANLFTVQPVFLHLIGQVITQPPLWRQIADLFTKLLQTSDWPAGWHSGNWTNFHGWLYILCDVGIWAAYFAIAISLLQIALKRKDVPFHKLFGLFIGFILLCGTIHLLDALAFWWPAYRLGALLRLSGAVVLAFTVRELKKITPALVSLRSVTELEAEINKRTVAEDRLAESEFLLTEAERIGRLGGWEKDFKTHKITWSKNLFDIYELPYHTDPTHIDLFNFLTDPYQKQLFDAFDAAEKNGLGWDIEILLTTAKGKNTWIRSVGEPVFKGGSLVKLRGVCIDIDRYKRNEMALNQSMELVTQNNLQLKNFTHILSHNIRNHASNISLITSLVDQDKLDAENADLFEQINNVSASLNITLNDLSQAIKIKEGVLKPDLMNFTEVYNRVMQVVEPDVVIHNVVIDIDFEQAYVLFPAIYLESIMMNLVTNAIKYRQIDTESQILLRTYLNDDNLLVFECIDNGIGIDLNLHANKVFGLYKTFHDRKDARGVGLFLVKTQIESQGGQIVVESTPGVGSVFRIIFGKSSISSNTVPEK
jgi:signal transduction histidine kinase